MTASASAGDDLRAKPHIGVILTGGTIESVGSDRTDLAWYIETGLRLAPGDLIAALPELALVARVEEIPFKRLPSHAMRDRDWLDLLRKVQAACDDEGFDGVVVTHGTNTLEETALFLHLTLRTSKPVVLIGTMRPSSAISADGCLNFFNAVRVASDPASRGKGCLVVMNDTIFSARDCTKNSTYRVEAFQSRDLGPLGVADADGKVIFYHHCARPHTRDTEFDVADLATLPRVDLATSYVGADGVMIAAAVQAGARAIVSAGTGAGRPTPDEDAAFDAAARDHGVIMCLSSRVASGRVVRSPVLKHRGFVASDNLQPWKARILMSLALTQTSDPEAIHKMFDTY